MTIPMWSPLAALAVVCGVYPRPSWVHRVDWLTVAVYASTLAVWPIVGVLVWWLVW